MWLNCSDEGEGRDPVVAPGGRPSPCGPGVGPRSVVMPDVRGPPRAGGGALGRGGPRFAPYARSSGPTPLSGRGLDEFPSYTGYNSPSPWSAAAVAALGLAGGPVARVRPPRTG